MCKVEAIRKSLYGTELSLMLCDDLEVLDGGGGRESDEVGMYVYLWMIHDAVLQKLAQHFKAIVFQFKKKVS